MSKLIADLKVIGNKKINNDFFIIELSGDQKLPEMRPGQFVQARVDGNADTFLRRPLSIHDVDYGRNSFKLLIQIAGSGTKKLSMLKTGDILNLIFPLGNSFTIPSREEKILLVGGGCGIAPLLFLAKTLKKSGLVPEILLGFRNKERIIEYEQYLEIGKVFLTTEDGSVGEKGYVTNHSILKTGSYHRVYCCGPDSMMKAVAAWARSNDAECEVSLENLMACGIGACLCCIVDTIKGNVCTCTEGPVFNIKDLKW
ncbi:MAG TPA: dihydroorotate dehydrogenase electron transfer subunit [Bacteroidales bacterium]|nr:dihydroorotate dehydrogenase electron transfer subunit [Bacteroidales bacterium]